MVNEELPPVAGTYHTFTDICAAQDELLFSLRRGQCLSLRTNAGDPEYLVARALVWHSRKGAEADTIIFTVEGWTWSQGLGPIPAKLQFRLNGRIELHGDVFHLWKLQNYSGEQTLEKFLESPEIKALREE